jgi:hypothetical protein
MMLELHAPLHPLCQNSIDRVLGGDFTHQQRIQMVLSHI